jgi:hypothetical protein
VGPLPLVVEGVPLVVERGGTLYPWRYRREVPLNPWWWREAGFRTPGSGERWDPVPVEVEEGGTSEPLVVARGGIPYPGGGGN